ncbi:MAG: multidrug transporter [Paenibacillus sp.]|uniref:Putative Flagellin, Flp1-like, domain n=1 Tax=Paenibacillus aquistagni TaxID=1852522 RepID=A0A1X7K471_9BACL|nr:Flp1 family type IVb pilin [Paenibacillus aquistagni]MBR2567587.1 multidrug transporter [Paenibacillus sp.]NMM53993.1 multidrug transporter [Paenibacillus aquistagni]SMG35406.1 Putative Flagellin, Flp1-like, domain [Paenibacillus aquistagni]
MLNAITKQANNLWTEEDGLGTVELVVIIAIIVVIALLFRKQIESFITDLFNKTKTKSNEIFK